MPRRLSDAERAERERVRAGRKSAREERERDALAKMFSSRARARFCSTLRSKSHDCSSTRVSAMSALALMIRLLYAAVVMRSRSIPVG